MARICREAGARVSAIVFLRDLDLPIGAVDPVFHGAQLAIDATLVSPPSRSTLIQSSWEAGAVPDSLWLQVRQAVVSRRKRRPSSCCALGPASPGFTDGARSCLVQLLVGCAWQSGHRW